MKGRWRTKKIRLISVLLIFAFLFTVLGYFVWNRSRPGKSADVAGTAQEVSVPEEAINRGNNEVVPDEETGTRWNIYDRHLDELAVSFMVASVYVKPLEVRAAPAEIRSLAELLGLEEKQLKSSIASERGVVWLKRNLSKEMAAKIENINMAGVYLVKENARYYPRGKIASHLVGFTEDGTGLAGIEAYYDNLLKGSVNGESENLRRAGINYSQDLAALDNSMVLTVDLSLQGHLEKQLARVVHENEGRSGMAILMMPANGEIVALANYPSYDSNLFWKYDSFERRNRILSEPVKLGGLHWMFKMAAEISAGNVPEFIAEVEEIARKIISPRLYKKVVSPKLQPKNENSPWQELEKGVFWSAPPRPFNSLLLMDNLEKIFKVYGLRGATGVDLPEYQSQAVEEELVEMSPGVDGQSTATLMQIVTAFSRLVGGRYDIVPHVLKAILNEKENVNIQTDFGSKDKATSDEIDSGFLKLLRALSTGIPGDALFVETIVEEMDDGLNQDFEIEADDESGLPEIDADKKVTEAVDKRYQYAIVSAAPSLAPEMVMALVVDGVADPHKKTSTMGLDVSKILAKSLALYKSKAGKKVKKKKLSEEKLYDNWRKLNRGSASENVTETREIREMPLVENLSLRKALQVLKGYDLRISAIGSGRVVSQHPKAGTKLKGIRDCVLELKTDN